MPSDGLPTQDGTTAVCDAPSKKPLALLDENGLFAKGNPGGPGRPKGCKNAQTALVRAAPKLVKHYLRRAKDSDAICIDARKWILPVEDELRPDGERPVIQVVFAGITNKIEDSSTTLPPADTYLTEHILCDLPDVVNQQPPAENVGGA